MSEADLLESTYYCNNCNSTRRFRIPRTKHEKLIEKSPNGLVLYSDIHPCTDRLLEVVNLRIDKDLNVRSFELLKLPEYKKQVVAIPVPSMNKDTDLAIVAIYRENQLNLKIQDHFMNYTLRIGRASATKDESIAISKLDSDLGGITLQYFPSHIFYTPAVENWLSKLINILEILPPTKPGLLISAFRYFIDRHEDYPNEFDETFMKTILASHEVIAKPSNSENKELLMVKHSFSDEDTELINRIIDEVNKSEISLLDFAKTSGKDFTDLIYLFLLLEKEDIIKVERPGIVAY